jgi:hypothetical protein
MLRSTFRLLAVVTLGLSLAACDSGNDLGVPTAPSGPRCSQTDISGCISETFTGSVNQNGGVTHSFNTVASGTVTATLTALGPNSAATLGMSLGTVSGTSPGTCQAVLTNDQATQGTVITGGVSALGSLCVRAYDTGSITAAVPFTYEITIVHP